VLLLQYLKVHLLQDLAFSSYQSLASLTKMEHISNSKNRNKLQRLFTVAIGVLY